MQITFTGFPTRRLEVTDLPALTGSEKQVAWATDIRANMLTNQLGQQFAQRAREATADQLATGLANMTTSFAALYANTSAKFWIDNRSGRDIRVLATDARKVA